MILTFKGRIYSPSFWTTGGEASQLQNQIANRLIERGIGIQSVTVFKPDVVLSIANFRSTYDIEIQTLSPKNENPYRVVSLLTAILAEMELQPSLRFVTDAERGNDQQNNILIYGGLALAGLVLLTTLIKK